MKELKSKVRKHDKPLEQLIIIYKEKYELLATPLVVKELSILTKKPNNGQLVDNIKDYNLKKLCLTISKLIF